MTRPQPQRAGRERRRSHWHDAFSRYWTKRAATDLRLFTPYELEYTAFKKGWIAALQARARVGSKRK